MKIDVERLMWEKVWRAYGGSLAMILRQALMGYKRTPGLDDLTRLYPSTVGHQGLLMLKAELMLRWPNEHFGHSDWCVELRSRLRSHLNQNLLRRLVHEYPDTPALRDALFAVDVGV